MQPTVYQKPEIRDANDNIIQQGAFGKNTALANATNDGWIDYVANDLEFLYDLAKDEVVPVPALPASGQTNKTYLLTTTGVSYRWSGTEWVSVSSSEAVGRAESAANLAEQWATKTDGTVDGTEYSAKYYAEQAEASADDARDVADDMADHLVQIDKNTGGVAKNSKRISNIEKLLQGNLYDYDTDDDSAYVKTVPSGALPYAGVEQIGGKTLVWNQLVNSGTTTVATISGHKYYTLINGTANIVTSSGSAITIVDDNADMVCDLTLMFGAGNEPTTVAEFEAMFPASYYPYNAGTLLSAGVTEVESMGKNLVPTYTESGSGNGLTWTANADGSLTINGTATADTYIRPAEYSTWTWDGVTPCWLSGCPASGGTTRYQLRMDTETDGLARATPDNGSGRELSDINSSHPIQGLPLRFCVVIRSGFVCNNLTFRPMLEYGSAATTYQPYVEALFPIPTAIQQLEGYGWSAGSVYNYIDFERKVFVKCVNRVDLSTLNWSVRTTSSSRRVLSSTLPSDYIGKGYTSLEWVCDVIYNGASSAAQLISDVDTVALGVYSYSDNGPARSVYVVVGDTSATTVNGTLLYGELATPVETDISQYLTDNLIEVGAFGTLTFPNANGDDYHIPVPSTETYMIDLQEAIENGN